MTEQVDVTKYKILKDRVLYLEKQKIAERYVKREWTHQMHEWVTFKRRVIFQLQDVLIYFDESVVTVRRKEKSCNKIVSTVPYIPIDSLLTLTLDLCQNLN